MSEDITDLTRGVYRRLYAGFIRGRRINSVSLMAEAWFWRVHAAADDFGNLDAEPLLCHAATAGRRSGEVSAGKVATLVGELVGARLLRVYAVDGEDFLHIVGFNAMQPANRSGRRIKRVPHSPWDETEDAGGIRGNPGESGAPIPTPIPIPIPNNPAAQGSAATAAAATAATPFLSFPTVGGKRGSSTTWIFAEPHVAELIETFPDVDVRGEARKALTWIRAKTSNRKTAGGMREFLFRWMSRANDRGGSRVNGHATRASGQDRQQDLIDAALATED